MTLSRLTPLPGAEALEVRRICDELAHSVAVIGRYGISDYSAIDDAGSAFLLAIIEWEIADERSRPWRWVHVLAACNDVMDAWRHAAQVCAAERDGEAESWKLG